jgi:hypothetical protein
MDKTAIIHLLVEKHDAFGKYINGLTDEEYQHCDQEKWTAEKQLEHIVLCLKPLVQVFSMDKKTIEQTFGKTERESVTYDVLLGQYLQKLNEGGKAPARYVPETTIQNQKEQLINELNVIVKKLCSLIELFAEQELDQLCIPHPLLGNLTMREMLYNTIYHVEHHQQQAVQNLKNKSV